MKPMLEPKESQYVAIGRIARSHGMDGTVMVIPAMDDPALFEHVDLIRFKNARGDLIPARIESVRKQQKNKRLTFFVKFEHIASRNQAEAVKAVELYIAKSSLSNSTEDRAAALWIGFEIADENGRKAGVVDEILNSAAHPILIVRSNAKELLIPVVDEYVTSIDEEFKTVNCKNLNRLAAL